MFRPMKEMITENELIIDEQTAEEKILPIEIVFNGIRESLKIYRISEPIRMKNIKKQAMSEDTIVAVTPTVVEIYIKTQSDYLSDIWKDIFEKAYEDKSKRECHLSFSNIALFGSFYGLMETISVNMESDYFDSSSMYGAVERAIVGMRTYITLEFTGMVVGNADKAKIIKAREEKTIRIMTRKLFFD